MLVEQKCLLQKGDLMNLMKPDIILEIILTYGRKEIVATVLTQVLSIAPRAQAHTMLTHSCLSYVYARLSV